MKITPIFNIEANNQDISDKLMERVVSLRINQKMGLGSDSCVLVVDDHLEHRIKLPGEDEKIRISLGYAQEEDEKEKLVDFGEYNVGEFALNGPRDLLTIYGDKCLWTKALKAPVKFSWESTPEKPLLLKDLFAKVAGNHGLEAKMSPELESIVLPQIEQSESDIQLLTRLAGYYDAVCKVQENVIFFMPRGTGKTLSGKGITEVALDVEDLLSWRTLHSQYPNYQSCRAWYHDFINATRTMVEVGSGDPCFDLSYTYADEATAKWAAQTRLNHAARVAKTIEIMVIGDPDIRAGGTVSISQVREGIDGSWFVAEVEHQIDKKGFTTKVICQQLTA
ncbi:phage tail protein [Thalassomonas viridans]|uniref:Phage tail protein n=1 Tax=Thalassomonas viridans TaxID=137584 RepID=A0AAF0C8X6_9GAMM|nr:contractile injection system protein, VgrG/Pvc8 family [Thalassomonas viridans]WDE04650.1 phage tail protein [Thalassomonas viridans]